MEAQNKLFNLNTSTKLDPARLQEYQFSGKQDLHLRKF